MPARMGCAPSYVGAWLLLLPLLCPATLSPARPERYMCNMQCCIWQLTCTSMQCTRYQHPGTTGTTQHDC